ncbi:hypothetical protein JL721_2871 [Aureococcus anophagefferens]|nr:hypothetical protein JL721_2871 [Aureococcus anophagefferens]
MRAAASLVLVLAAVARGCVDDASFVDRRGRACAAHARWDCESYAADYPALYTAADADEIAAACPLACGRCSAACPAGRANFTASDYDGLKAILDAEACADVTISGRVVVRATASVVTQPEPGEDEPRGGPIRADGAVRAWHCEFRNCSAGTYTNTNGMVFWEWWTVTRGLGGAIFSLADVAVGFTNFTGCRADDGGGAIHAYMADVAIRPGSGFFGNVGTAGGAVHHSSYGALDAGDADDERCATGPPLRFVGNAAVAEDDYEDDILSGGAIHSSGCSVKLANVCAGGPARPFATVADAVFEDHAASGGGQNGNGGVLRFVGPAYYWWVWIEPAVTLSRVVVDGAAARRGGFVHSTSATLAVEDVTVVATAASKSGGGFHGAVATFAGANATACAADSGGCFYVAGAAAVEFAGGALTSCSASAGGALFVTGDASVSLADAFAASASATYTGGFAHLSDGTIDGAGTTRVAGSFAEGGAGIYVADGAYGRLRGVAFAGGEALQGAVLYCAVSATCDLRDARSSANVATHEGALLYAERSAVVAIDGVLSAGDAAPTAIFGLTTGAALSMSNATIDFPNAVCCCVSAVGAARLVLADVRIADAFSKTAGAAIFADFTKVVLRGVTVDGAVDATAPRLTSLSRNFAAVDGGGAALVRGAALSSAGAAVVEGNEASSGSGGGLNASNASVMFAAPGDQIRGNAAPRGGGGAAFYDASGVVFNASVEARVLDLYGSVVATSDGESVLLDVEGAELTGDSKGFTVAGRAVFRGVTLTRAPNASLTLRAEVVGAAPRLEAAAAVVLRACVAGEYVATNALSGTSTCLVCAAGSVSFAPSESCAACPKHATCAGGRRLVPDRGYWRSRRDSLNVVRCKENYCRSVDLLDEAPRDDVRAPSGACAGKHAGPRCARCERHHYFDGATLKCAKCCAPKTRSLWVALAVVAACVAAGAAAARWVLAWLRRRFAGSKDVFEDISARWMPWLVPKLKILLVTLQIVGSFQETFAAVSFPELFSSLLKRLRVLGLDPTTFLAAGTACDRPGWDYLFRLELFTALPVALLAPRGRRWRDSSWLAADYAVSCRSRRYAVHRVYAIFCIFIYPVGVPAVFLALLLSVRDRVTARDYDVFVRNVLKGGDDVLAVSSAQVGGKGPESPAELRFRENYASKSSARRRSTVFSRRYETGLKVYGAADEYVRVRSSLGALRSPESPGNTREAADACLATLGENILTSHREIDPACAHLAFLFSEYAPRCWYFEVAECLRRISLTGFLVVYDDESIGKIYTASMLSLAFAVVYAYLSPYGDDSTNRFATAMQCVIFLQLFLTIMLYAETHIDDDDVRAGWPPRRRFGVIMGTRRNGASREKEGAARLETRSGKRKNGAEKKDGEPSDIAIYDVYQGGREQAIL